MSSDRADLAAAFTKPNRVAKPSAPQTPREPVVSLVREEPEAQQVLDEPIGNVSVHLPASLRVKAFEAARVRGISITELLFAALDAVLDPAAAGAVELFPAEPRSRSGMPMARRRTRGGEGTVQVQLRLSKTQKQWLEEQSEAHGAANRSAFVTAVFRSYLPS